MTIAWRAHGLLQRDFQHGDAERRQLDFLQRGFCRQFLDGDVGLARIVIGHRVGIGDHPAAAFAAGSQALDLRRDPVLVVTGVDQADGQILPSAVRAAATSTNSLPP